MPRYRIRASTFRNSGARIMSQQGVSHGIFRRRTWRAEIMPRIPALIESHNELMRRYGAHGCGVADEFSAGFDAGLDLGQGRGLRTHLIYYV